MDYVSPHFTTNPNDQAGEEDVAPDLESGSDSTRDYPATSAGSRSVDVKLMTPEERSKLRLKILSHGSSVNG